MGQGRSTTSIHADLVSSSRPDVGNVIYPLFSPVLLFLLFLSGRSALAQEVPANPTRPSVSDNGFLTARGYLELELGWAQTASLGTLPMLLKMTPDRSFEIGVSATGLANKERGEPLTLGIPGAQLKWQFAAGEWGAFASVLHIDWPSTGPPVLTAYPVLSIRNASTAIDVTGGYSVQEPFSPGREGSLFYALSVSPNINAPIGLYVEVYGILSPGDPLHALDTGLSFSVSPDFVLDCSLGTSLTSNGEHWTLQLGLTKTLARLFP